MDAGIGVAAKHVDIYLNWGEPVDQVKEKFDPVRGGGAKSQDPLPVAINLIVPETGAEALAAADRLISRVTDDVIAESVGRGASPPCTRAAGASTALKNNAPSNGHRPNAPAMAAEPCLRSSSGAGEAACL